MNLLEKYGQVGKAGYTGNLNHHNSFTIEDFDEVYVWEVDEKH